MPEDGGYITAVHAGCPHWKPLSPGTLNGLSRFHRDPLSGRTKARSGQLVDDQRHDAGGAGLPEQGGSHGHRPAGPVAVVDEKNGSVSGQLCPCLLYTSDAADEEDSVDLGG